MKKLIFLSFMLLSGCYSIEVNVQSVKVWEGHYFTVDELQKKVQSIELENGESIWLLSNTTLKNVIKNVK